MSPIWLVLSGAYVENELTAEFGPLPPAMLPVGTQRLYELQLAHLPRGGVHLTLPEDYVLPAPDASRLAELGVTVIGTPEGLSLGQAVIWALNCIGAGQTPVHILHGDTVVEGVDLACLNAIAADDSSDGYSWAEVEAQNGRVLSLTTVRGGGAGERRRPAACGYFAFDNSLSLIRSLTRAGGDFVGGLNRYCQEHEVALLPVANWLDFGHVQTFFRSRRAVTTARAFNTLKIDDRTVRKSSLDAAKLRAEAAWLSQVPAPVRPYCARLIDSGDDTHGGSFYETEYEYLPTLSELFVYGANAKAGWSLIMASCEDFLQTCARHRGPGSGDTALRALTTVKTAARLEQFARDTGFDIHRPNRYDGRALPSLMQVAQSLVDFVDTGSGRAESVMHGDFCFSNILFNGRTRRIRVIDPRGFVLPGQPSVYGDSRYDLAKFAHSVLGRYDQIVAGRCSVGGSEHDYDLAFENLPHQRWVEAMLAEMLVNGARGTGPEIRAVIVDLFLSMLPLHADRPDRQRAFIANALRLYAQLQEPAR